MIQQTRWIAALVGAMVGLVGCGGGGGGSAAPPPMPPVVSLTSDVTTGTAPVTAHLDASGSTDPGGFPITYAWTISVGGTLSSATGSAVTATLPNHGSYTVTVTASDGHAATSSSKNYTVTVNPAPPTITALTIPVNSLGLTQTNVSSQLVATDRESLTLAYSITTPPTTGTATINSGTGAVSYTAPADPNATSDSFVVQVGNLGASATSTVHVALNSDPLLGNQWHLRNTAQDAFTVVRPVAGNDMNVAGAWSAGYSGKGIKVGVVDSGLEAAHEDLAANVDLSHSWNFQTGASDPTRQVSDVGHDHGTEVSGIIGAVAFNGKGGRGVAYNATLRGYNWLAAPGVTDTVPNMSKSLGGDPVSSDNDLFNASFETTQGYSLPQFLNTYQAITGTTIALRNGLGATIVNAAGNEFVSWGPNQPAALCNIAIKYAISCGDTSADLRRGGYAPLVVAATNAAGVHSSYSNTGSSVWISAPGGEYGISSAYVPGATDTDPAIVTTSRDGCTTNTNYPTAVNALDNLGVNPLAANCQYTATMNGTSAATPNVAGVVALMLEANPALSTRDIKYILAKTARHIDPSFAGVSAELPPVCLTPS